MWEEVLSSAFAKYGAVAVEGGVLLVVVGRLRAKRVNHADMASERGRREAVVSSVC